MNNFTSIESNSDIEYLNSYTAKLIENTLIELASKQETVIFALCGGRSVGAIFELLSQNENIPWHKVHFFMVDERLVPIDDVDSNYKLADEILITPLKQKGLISKTNCHPFILDKNSTDFGVAKYSDELDSLGGKFDLALLSCGEDGHIGAIYPSHHSFNDESEFYMFMDDSPKPPPERMSASRKLILKSQSAILMLMGDSKKEAFKKLSDNEVEPKDCPVKLVKQLPTSYLITTHK